jgi:hypothetical protein
VAENQETTSSLKGTDTKTIGMIGAILMSGVEAIPFEDIPVLKETHVIKQATLASVPFFSAFIATVITWILAWIKPQNANKILLSRTLKKKEKEIKIKLSDPNIPKDAKKDLQDMLKKIAVDQINLIDFT